MTRQDEGWGKFSEWYAELLEQKDTYQKAVILPNLSRLLSIKKGETILDLACGPGFFAREFFKQGARVIGGDVSGQLIKLAMKNSKKNINFQVAPADNMPFLKNKSVDKIVIIHAIQNIHNVSGVFKECARVLKINGRMLIVMNHPAFRIPRASGWDWDPSTTLRTSEKGVMYRRIDRYLSESKVKIQMRPGDKPNEYTLSFHRPLQFYFKALNKNGFLISRLEEWISHRKSEPGPRAIAEDRARKEIPLFLFIEAVH